MIKKNYLKIIIIITFIILSIKIALYSFAPIAIINDKYFDWIYDTEVSLKMNNDISVKAKYNRMSSSACKRGISTIIDNWKEEILLEDIYEHNPTGLLCTIGFEYINKYIFRAKICYTWWAGSWECDVAYMDYNLDTKKWSFKSTDFYYSWEDEYSLWLKTRLYFYKQLSFIYKADNKANDYFNSPFFELIYYFSSRNILESYEWIDNIYINRSNLLSEDEKNIILNTIYKYPNLKVRYRWSLYSIFFDKIEYFYKKELTKEDEKIIWKYQYISWLDISTLKDIEYNENIWTDTELESIFLEYIERTKNKK